ncbi:hypothetical protein B0T20DRAFT_418976 [Sordaria brevicollis]|uniref:Secreted protein n=1 Tax=Sordaria brevicollis TaxID=83679 RepID=A0AAE0P9F6_SORBR|nr:hypothetical protein B0T20DRAFT_418976 [Sordaria brevicollis]
MYITLSLLTCLLILPTIKTEKSHRRQNANRFHFHKPIYAFPTTNTKVGFNSPADSSSFSSSPSPSFPSCFSKMQ